MTKGAAFLWLAALIGAAFFISAIVEAATGANVGQGENLAELILGGGSLFAWSGVIPLVWWGIRRFECKLALPPAADVVGYAGSRRFPVASRHHHRSDLVTPCRERMPKLIVFAPWERRWRGARCRRCLQRGRAQTTGCSGSVVGMTISP